MSISYIMSIWVWWVDGNHSRILVIFVIVCGIQINTKSLIESASHHFGDSYVEIAIFLPKCLSFYRKFQSTFMWF